MKQAIKLDKLFIAFFAFLCAYPTLHYYFSIDTKALSIIDFVLAVLPEIFALGLVICTTFIYSNFRSTNILNTFDKWLIAYFLFSIIYGSILSMHFQAIIQGFRITYFPFIFYFIGRVIPSNSLNKNYINPVFKIFGIMAFVGFVLYFFVPNFNLEMIQKISGVVNQYLIVRMTSILWTPVVFGSLMGFAVLYFNYKYLMFDRLDIYNWVYFIFCWLGVFLSVSRGPIICSITLSALMVFYFGKPKCKRNLIIFIIGLYLISILLASLQQQILYNGGSFIALFFNMVHFTISSAGETVMLEEGLSRVELWQKSWQDFMIQPWGYGLGKSGHVAWKLFKDSNIKSSPYSTDGYYLKLLGEQGIIGATFFIAIIYVLYSKIRSINIFAQANFYSYFIFLFLFVLIQNIVSNVLDYYIVAPLFYFSLGAFGKYVYEFKT
jgi:hypothetical protein